VWQVFLALLGRPSVEGRAELALPHPEPLEQTAALVAELRRIHGLDGEAAEEGAGEDRMDAD